MHHDKRGAALLCTCFNPRPTVRPGDACATPWVTPRIRLFQSAPDREAGRCDARHAA